MERKRLCGQWYELASIYVPDRLVPVLKGYREQLRKGDGCEAWQDMRRRYNEREFDGKEWHYGDAQYLLGLMFALNTTTPIDMRLLGYANTRPTDELEREVWNMRKDEPCTRMSLRVRLGDFQRAAYWDFQRAVEQKMRSYKTDFYLHDMKMLARELGRKPLLWVVGQSHTMHEVLDAEGEAEAWAGTDQEESRQRFVYGGEDDTWMGGALRTLCGKDDDYYYHDGAELHKVSRDRFKAIHDRYVQRVRELTREKVELTKAA